MHKYTKMATVFPQLPSKLCVCVSFIFQDTLCPIISSLLLLSATTKRIELVIDRMAKKQSLPMIYCNTFTRVCQWTIQADWLACQICLSKKRLCN